jgi:hypothetical protein
MLDLLFLGIVIAFFAVAIAYARACDSGIGAS